MHWAHVPGAAGTGLSLVWLGDPPASLLLVLVLPTAAKHVWERLESDHASESKSMHGLGWRSVLGDTGGSPNRGPRKGWEGSYPRGGLPKSCCDPADGLGQVVVRGGMRAS